MTPIDLSTKPGQPQQFLADEMILDAVLRNLELLGEAAKQIPDDMRLRHPTVPWRQITGLPDILAHVYFGLEDDTIWQTVSRSVPALAKQLTAATAIELPGPTQPRICWRSSVSACFSSHNLAMDLSHHIPALIECRSQCPELMQGTPSLTYIGSSALLWLFVCAAPFPERKMLALKISVHSVNFFLIGIFGFGFLASDPSHTPSHKDRKE